MRRRKVFPENAVFPVLAAFLLSSSACLVQVERAGSEKLAETFYPAGQRTAEISTSPASSPHRLVCLIYGKKENQLVKAVLPYWMVKKGIFRLDEGAGGHGPERAENRPEKKVLKKIFTRMPVGLLLEVWSEKEKVLIWLE